MELRKCKLCNNDFYTDKKTWVCKTCQNKKYHNKLYNKLCAKCNIEFQGTYHQTLCPVCRNSAHQNSLFKNQHTIKYICKSCNILIREVIKNNTNKCSMNIIKYQLCKQCKSKLSSDRMKLKNPNRDNTFNSMDEYLKFKENIETKLKLDKELNELFTIKELIQKLNNINQTPKFKINSSNQCIIASLRMQLNNPMYNDSVKEKLKNTIIDKRLNYIKNINFGNTRNNYTGRRQTLQYLRDDLKPWRKNLLHLSNYTCQLCGKHGGTLHIHHIIAFRDIIANILDELNISAEEFNKIKHLDERYLQIQEKLLSFHINNNCGIVVCPCCHDKIDEHYHIEEKFKKDILNEN